MNKYLLAKYCLCVRIIRAGRAVCFYSVFPSSGVSLLDLNYSYNSYQSNYTFLWTIIVEDNILQSVGCIPSTAAVWM